MATTAGLLSRLRLELADARVPFTSSVVGDGATRRYELPHSPVESSDFQAFTATAATPPVTTTLVAGTDYTLDALNGVITLTDPLAAGVTLVSRGSASRFFNDGDLGVFLDTAFILHSHGTGQTLATLPKVEDYLVVLMATIEALYALLNDAAFDIDVNTPEGVSIPRSQRFRQLMQLIEERKEQYEELATALNVGLKRVEMFNLRRVSRTTGRYVPMYIDREIEDASPPRRVYQPISLQGATPVVDPAPTEDITLEQGMPFVKDLALGVDLTGATVRAQLRRHDQAGPLVYFDVTILDSVTGAVRIALPDTSRRRFYFNGDLSWSITSETVNARRTLRKGKVLIVERPLL